MSLVIQRSLALGCAVVLAACGSSDGGAPGSGSATPSTSSAPSASAAPTATKLPGFDLEGTLDGKPIEFASAIAYQRPGDAATHVLVSTHPHDCETPKRGGLSLRQGETLFRLEVVDMLTPDGKPRWGLTSSYYGGSTNGHSASDVVVERGEAAAPMTLSFERLELKAAGNDKRPLALRGAIVAKQCGVIPEQGGGRPMPPARPQPDLSFEIAGQKIEVMGAIYRGERKDVILTTMPMSCEQSPYSQSDVALLLDADLKSANLQGRRIAPGSGATPDPKPKLVLGKTTDGVVEVSIDGEFELGPWPVKLAGKVSALVCADK